METELFDVKAYQNKESYFDWEMDTIANFPQKKSTSLALVEKNSDDCVLVVADPNQTADLGTIPKYLVDLDELPTEQLLTILDRVLASRGMLLPIDRSQFPPRNFSHGFTQPYKSGSNFYWRYCYHLPSGKKNFHIKGGNICSPIARANRDAVELMIANRVPIDEIVLFVQSL
jgi:hypothetical protein